MSAWKKQTPDSLKTENHWMQQDTGVTIWYDGEWTHTVHISIKALTVVLTTMENLPTWFLSFSPVESTEPTDL